MKGSSYLRGSIGLFAAMAIAGGALAQAGGPGDVEHHGKHHHHGDKGDDADQPGQPGTPGEAGTPGAAPPAGSGDNGPPTVSAASGLAPVAASPAGRNLGAMSGGGAMANVTAGPLFTGLNVVVTTGDDDLRSDSLAWIDVRGPDGAVQKCSFKQSELTLENNSTTPAKCTLSNPLTSDQLKAASFALEYNGNAGTLIGSPEAAAAAMSHSTDNWKVNAIQISATAPGQSDQCVLDEKGSPMLAELKGDNPKVELSGACP